MITIKQLNYALAVEKTLHFKNAAQVCHVSQSALSTAITELEKQLGVVLFERTNKNVLVTSVGKVFLDRARNVKLEIDGMYELANAHKAPLAAPMKIGVIPTISPYLLPKVLPKVREDYPHSKLHIIEEQSHVVVDMVRTGELDTAILALPYPIEGLMAFEFWQEDFYWVSHKDESPVNVNEISAEEMMLEKLMLLKDGHCLKDHALAACSLQGEQADNELNATSLHTLVQMVAGKLGTTLVPQIALDQLIHHQSELQAIHLNEPGPHRRFAFIIRPNYVATKNIEVLMALFKGELVKRLRRAKPFE